MGVKLTNLARARLAQAITATDTVLHVEPGQGEMFPELGPNDWFPVALENDLAQIEYCKATARNGDAITVERGAEGTLPRAYAAGDACELRLTVAALMELGGGGTGTDPVISISDGVLVEDPDPEPPTGTNPVVVSSNPDGSAGTFYPGPVDLEVIFDQAIKAGSGSIYIEASAADTVITPIEEDLPVSSPRVLFNGETLKVTGLDQIWSTEYKRYLDLIYVRLLPGNVLSQDGDLPADFSPNDRWAISFRIESPDPMPVLDDYSPHQLPVIGTPTVPRNAEFSLEFTENISKSQSDNVFVRVRLLSRHTGSPLVNAYYSILDPRFVISGKKLIINPMDFWATPDDIGAAYITIPPGVVRTENGYNVYKFGFGLFASGPVLFTNYIYSIGSDFELSAIFVDP